jgi:hypothetical protein
MPSPPVLRFGVGSSPPTSSDIKVFDTLDTTFVGEPFTFDVIGSSHYIHSGTCGFYELCSCNSMEDDEFHVCTVDFNEKTSRELAYSTDSGLECRTTIDVRPLRETPGEESSDLYHEFAEGAYTAILIGEDRYDTFHTYPEHDIVVQTRTRILLGESEPLESYRPATVENRKGSHRGYR